MNDNASIEKIFENKLYETSDFGPIDISVLGCFFDQTRSKVLQS